MGHSLTRRQFSAAMAALGLRAATASPQLPAHMEHFVLSRNGWMPNNERMPVLWYRGAFRPESGDVASVMERVFMENGWPPQWRNGVYSFHHYHSTAHEVLGFAHGSANLMLGGENGRLLKVQGGDVLVLPTGTGHCRLQASEDFLVVGAYPEDQHWDICRAAPDATATDRMRSLPFPASDPVEGLHGSLTALWHR